MKLFLNESQRSYLLEVFKASENNAINGKDLELAKAFSDLYHKIKPTNVAFYKLNRGETETIIEFCEIVASSLTNAINFLNNDKDRSEEEKLKLLQEAEAAKTEIELILKQLQEKVKVNPV